MPAHFNFSQETKHDYCLGLSSGDIGTIVLVAQITDAISNPSVGILIEHLKIPLFGFVTFPHELLLLRFIVHGNCLGFFVRHDIPARKKPEVLKKKAWGKPVNPGV